MKKIIFSVTSAFCFFALTQSCNRQENLPPDASAIDEKEPTSVIDQMEKERGVKFFKKDVVLKDANGSEITMRFASENESSLDNYLLYNDVAIKLISSINDTDKSVQGQVENRNPIASSPVDPKLSVITEVLSLNLRDNVLGYRLTVKPKQNVLASNGRTAVDYTSYAEHVSINWPAKISVTVDNAYNAINSIQFAIDAKWKWYSGWENWFGWGTAYSNVTSSKTDIFNVDGPWRANAKVYYTPLLFKVGYSIEFLRY